MERKRNWRRYIAEELERSFQIKDALHLSALSNMLLAMIDGLAIQLLVEPGSVNSNEIALTLAEMIKLLASAESHE